MSRNKLHQSGFTIIELTLAMTFLAFVLVFSATIVVQISNTYFKGLSIKQINQAGRAITDDLSRSLQGASTSDINLTQVNNGLLCIGETAYIWNPVYLGTAYNSSNINRYKTASKPISLARVAKSDVGNCLGLLPVNIPSSADNLAILSGNSRVITASAERSQADPKLVKVRFIIGTFDNSELTYFNTGNLSQINNSVYYDGTKFTCREDRFGNFCALAEFQTTVYVTR